MSHDPGANEYHRVGNVSFERDVEKARKGSWNVVVPTFLLMLLWYGMCPPNFSISFSKTT